MGLYVKFQRLYKKLLGETNYRGSHTAPDLSYGAPAHKLDDIYPDDIYGPDALRFYGGGPEYRKMDGDTFNILLSVRDNPDAKVRIYRAVPKDVDAEINKGDWVTINKDYAVMHGRRFDDGFKILDKIVKAKDIITNGDSIQEFGYQPESN